MDLIYVNQKVIVQRTCPVFGQIGPLSTPFFNSEGHSRTVIAGIPGPHYDKGLKFIGVQMLADTTEAFRCDA